MAKIEITKTELVWPGKYNEDGTLKEVPRVSLPFQVIETVNESRATREAKKGGVQQTLFDVWEGKEGDTFEEGWRNKLIWGDNLLVMGSLLEKFAGKIDLIYIDPPFATGADFSFTAEIGESGEEVTKEQSDRGKGVPGYVGERMGSPVHQPGRIRAFGLCDTEARGASGKRASGFVAGGRPRRRLLLRLRHHACRRRETRPPVDRL
jgi:hypothetical protein